jgi:DNA modification methylase
VVREIKSEIKRGDCLEVLQKYPDNTFDLIVTSPPYADRRKHTYGGVPPEKYVEWFLPRSQEFLRVVKPSGTFVLNIKEKAENGERHTFVIELILALRKQGWLWTEEFIWHKKNCYPGKWPNRFRDSWERCLQFNKTRHFKMNQEAVMVPMGDWKEARLKSLGRNDIIRFDSQVGSGFGKNIANWIGRDKAYPTNVLHLATECGNKNHSAAFPQELPEWFIKLFTDEGDWVLDPFVGSGTTCVAAQALRRNSIGIEIKHEYYELAEAEVFSTDMMLMEKGNHYGQNNGRGNNSIHRGKTVAAPQKQVKKAH